MRPDPYDYEERSHRPPVPSGNAGVLTYLVLVGLGMLLGGVALWVVGAFRGKDVPLNDPDARPREPVPAEPLDYDEREAVNLFKKLKPSVVNVDIVQVRRTIWDDRPAEFQTGTGSGFIWDDEGRIVTNYHVIEQLFLNPRETRFDPRFARRNPNTVPRVVLSDRSAYDTLVVGFDPDSDLAVLQFDPQNRPAKDKIRKIELGTSHDLEVGQKVYAIGNPFGLSLTMTRGIISALDRSIETPGGSRIYGCIQTDAAINPGNSGGPLLDKSGRLIGVNTAITTPAENGGNVGIGFAIPADTVNQVVTQIIRNGRALRPTLGIAKLVDQQKLRRARYDHGVMIESLVPKGPAERAGLQGIRVNAAGRIVQVGDIILAINGEPIESHEDFERVQRKLKPGETATLRIQRQDTEMDVVLTVGGA